MVRNLQNLPALIAHVCVHLIALYCIIPCFCVMHACTVFSGYKPHFGCAFCCEELGVHLIQRTLERTSCPESYPGRYVMCLLTCGALSTTFICTSTYSSYLTVFSCGHVLVILEIASVDHSTFFPAPAILASQ